ncbi:MAG TPA: DNA mismatch repair endonuclease MutL [Bacteroidales bacterium]|nr:DNA mismatch repair endonuclease MutL [Bacteroidales bacterium]
MPDIIKLLPDSVANQIAAGEVIQRPASLVKELMENSVDADSKNIRVIIKDAGSSLVQVIDNGIGMSETDCRLSFERHATSKINTAEDLFAISTKGFRGEALASIAAVAMVEMKTRQHDNDIGTLLKINGSKVELQEPVSCAPGSNIAVKNLFYNVPARRKFLKTASTEMRHIINEFQRVVIAHPGTRFSLHHNDKEIFNLPPSNERQRIIAVFGKSMNQNLISINTETSLVKISGFIGKPENARKTYGEQFFFINNRYMRHAYLHKAIMKAYEKILQPESVPAYFIFMNADPSTIDVNIHPTKTEIKFENERIIWQILNASVRESLGKFNIVPSLDFENEGIIDIPPSGKGPAKMPVIDINTGFNPFRDEENYNDLKKTYRKERDSNLSGWEKLYAGMEGSSSEQIILGQKKDDNDGTDLIIHEKIFQVRNKYIVCSVKLGLMVIDQKRAHERILYEKFINALQNDSVVAQKSLFPKTLELDQADIALLSEIEEEIKYCGLDIRYLGNNTISINSQPSDSMNEDPREMLEIILEQYKSTEKKPGESNREKIAICMSRAAAVPYGRTLEMPEITGLVNKLFQSKNPNYSPTGKTIISIINLEELEKRLK